MTAIWQLQRVIFRSRFLERNENIRRAVRLYEARMSHRILYAVRVVRSAWRRVHGLRERRGDEVCEKSTVRNQYSKENFLIQAVEEKQEITGEQRNDARLRHKPTHISRFRYETAFTWSCLFRRNAFFFKYSIKYLNKIQLHVFTLKNLYIKS